MMNNVFFKACTCDFETTDKCHFNNIWMRANVDQISSF